MQLLMQALFSGDLRSEEGLARQSNIRSTPEEDDFVAFLDVEATSGATIADDREGKDDPPLLETEDIELNGLAELSPSVVLGFGAEIAKTDLDRQEGSIISSAGNSGVPKVGEIASALVIKNGSVTPETLAKVIDTVNEDLQSSGSVLDTTLPTSKATVPTVSAPKEGSPVQAPILRGNVESSAPEARDTVKSVPGNVPDVSLNDPARSRSELVPQVHIEGARQIEWPSANEETPVSLADIPSEKEDIGAALPFLEGRAQGRDALRPAEHNSGVVNDSLKNGRALLADKVPVLAAPAANKVTEGPSNFAEGETATVQRVDSETAEFDQWRPERSSGGVQVTNGASVSNSAPILSAVPGLGEPTYIRDGSPNLPEQSSAIASLEADEAAKAANERTRPEPVAPRSIISQVIHTVSRTQAEGVVEIRLQPEELGRVRLTMSPNEAGLTVQIAAERAETLDLLRRNIDMLASDLRERGFEGFSFSFGSEGSQQDFEFDDPEQSSDKQKGNTNAPQQLSVDLTPLRAINQDGRLDIRV